MAIIRRFSNSIILSLGFTVVVAMCASEVAAIGPRGGGGGSRGGGAASRGGASRPSASRPSPSMSRPSGGSRSSTPSAGARPKTPSTGARPGTPSTGGRPNMPTAGGRPSQGDLNKFLDLPSSGGSGRPGSPSTRPAPAPGGGAASDFLNNRPPGSSNRPNTGQLPGMSDGSNRQDNRSNRREDATDNRSDRRSNVGENRSDRRENVSDNRNDRRDNVSDNRAGRIENRQEWQENRNARRDHVHDHMQRYPLRGDFWRDHPRWGRWAVTRPYRWATWAAVTSWFPWRWSQPVTYNYGENIYYQDNSVYQEGEEVTSADEYAAEAYDITEAAPEETDSDEWMSLGIFAVTQDGEESGPPPTMFFQLVVSKTGIIAGTFYDQTSEKSVEIEGAVDPESQRTAWVGSGKQWPIVETGISNLTEDAAPALVHFEDGQTQQILLVRLEDPEAATN